MSQVPWDFKKISVFKETKDDWHPAYSLDNYKLVRLCFSHLTNRMWRVCVLGADDFGLEKDFLPTQGGKS